MSSITGRTGVIRNSGYGSAARPVGPIYRSNSQEMGGPNRITPEQMEAYRQQYQGVVTPGGYLGNIQLPRYQNPADMVGWLQKAIASTDPGNARMQRFLGQQLQQYQRQVRPGQQPTGGQPPTGSQPGSQASSVPAQQGIAVGEPNPSQPRGNQGAAEANPFLAAMREEQTRAAELESRPRQNTQSGPPVDPNRLTFLQDMSPEMRNREGSFFDRLGLFNVERNPQGDVTGITQKGLDQLQGMKGFVDAQNTGNPFQALLGRAISQNASNLPFELNGQPTNPYWTQQYANSVTGSPGLLEQTAPGVNPQELLQRGAAGYADYIQRGIFPQQFGVTGGGAPFSTASASWLAQNPAAAQQREAAQIGYEKGLLSPEYKQASQEYLNRTRVNPTPSTPQLSTQSRPVASSSPAPSGTPAMPSPTQPQMMGARPLAGMPRPQSPSQIGMPSGMAPGAISNPAPQQTGGMPNFGMPQSPSQVGPVNMPPLGMQTPSQMMQRPMAGGPFSQSQVNTSGMLAGGQLGSGMSGLPMQVGGGSMPSFPSQANSGGMPGMPMQTGPRPAPSYPSQSGGRPMPGLPMQVGPRPGPSLPTSNRPMPGLPRQTGPLGAMMPQAQFGMPGNTMPGMRLPYQF